MSAGAFGQEVKRLRLEKGKTQRELAEAADIDVTYLSKIETGKVSPPAPEKIDALARALQADSDELLVLAEKVPRDLIANAVAGKPEALRFLRKVEAWSRRDAQHTLRRGSRKK